MRRLRAGFSGRGAGLGAVVVGGAVGVGTGGVWAACLFELWRECSDMVRTPPADVPGGAGLGPGVPGDGGCTTGRTVGADADRAVVTGEAGGAATPTDRSTGGFGPGSIG